MKLKHKRIIIAVTSLLAVISAIVVYYFIIKDNNIIHKIIINDSTYVGTYGIFEVHKTTDGFFYVINVITNQTSEDFYDVQPLCYTEYKNFCKADLLIVTKEGYDQYLYNSGGLSVPMGGISYVYKSSSKVEHRDYYILGEGPYYYVINKEGKTIFRNTRNEMDYAEGNKIVLKLNGKDIVVSPNEKDNCIKKSTYGDYGIYEILYIKATDKFFIKNDKTGKCFGDPCTSYDEIYPICYEGNNETCKSDYLLKHHDQYGDELFDYKNGSAVFIDKDAKVIIPETNVSHRNYYIVEKKQCDTDNENECTLKYAIASKDHFRQLDYSYDKIEFLEDEIFKVTENGETYIIDGNGIEVNDVMYDDFLSACYGHYNNDYYEYDTLLNKNLIKLGYLDKNNKYFNTSIESIEDKRNASQKIIDSIINLIDTKNWNSLSQILGYRETCNVALFVINNINIRGCEWTTNNDFVYELEFDISNPKKIRDIDYGKYMHIKFNNDDTIDIFVSDYSL